MHGSTNEHSLRTLSKVLLTKLENQKWILLNPKDRNEVREEFYQHLKKDILTEQDLTQMARDAVAKNTQSISDANLTETDAFKSKKRMLKEQYEDNAIAGFYLKRSLRDVVKGVGQFLFSSTYIEDVFESDENIHRLVQDTISKFDESKIA